MPPPPPDAPPSPPPPPSSPMPEPPTSGVLHATEQTRTYPCPSCGGELRFDVTTQKLRCADCGTIRELTADTTAVVAERDLRSALEALQSRGPDAMRSFAGASKEIVCQNCGGHTTFDGSLTADRCPYCATPIQRSDVHDAPDRIAVDGVVPFQVDEKKAHELIEGWINSRWFAPSEFKTYNRTGSFSSVYMAYFTYDAETSTDYTGRRGDDYTVTVGSGETQRTETRTRWRHAAGVVENTFDDVPVFANDGFDASRIAKLEPWPTQTAKTYSPEYVAGHLCRTYDRDVTQMEAEIQQTVKRDIGGDRQEIHSMRIDWRSMTYKHLLLPIWLLTVIYQERPFQVYINGVTGEVQGARPWSKVKIIVAAVIAAIVIITLVILFSSRRS
jgi:DNA-directed RNA polymerase subunit RPC12/RpoP